MPTGNVAAATHPPFVLRGRLLTPLGSGGTLFEDDAVVAADASGRLTFAGATAARPDLAEGALDLRPFLLLPGLVDLHAHLPQVPNAGLGAGLDLLSWLDRYIFPLERDFDVATAERLAPAAYRAFARAGTTTVLLYGAVYAASLDAAFRAADAHGIRAIIGKVMMDTLRYDSTVPDADVLETSLRESAELCRRWHMHDQGRLRYAYTPRFAVSCSARMMSRSARLATESGAYWQTHLSEDRGEMAAVARLFPDALDYTDVYDRAGGLGPQTVLAHAIHLSDRELGRLVETGSRVAHCPESNLFLRSGVMPLARYLEAGLIVGLGSDVAAGPDVSIFRQMRVGSQAQAVMMALEGDRRPALDPLGWLRMGSLDGARALGLDSSIGSLEPGKEADIIAIDPSLTAIIPGLEHADPEELMSRLIFRGHPDMVRAAWVRGRLLAGADGQP